MIQMLKNLRDFWLVKIKWRRYKIGSHFHAGRGVFIWGRDSVEIGHHCYIGKYSVIESDVKIGNYVMFSNFVALVGRYDHHFQQLGVPMRMASAIRDKDYDWKGLQQQIVIEDDVWVGYGAIVLSGVTLGKGSIVAAGSVVTHDVEPYAIYGGNPARKITDRFRNSEDLKKHLELEKEYR